MEAMPPDADRPRAGPVRTSQLIGRGRDLQAQAGRRLLTARDEHVTVKLVIDALREDRDTGGALLAGALAFRLFLWLLPAGLVVVALLGFTSAEQVHSDLTGRGPRWLHRVDHRPGRGAGPAGPLGPAAHRRRRALLDLRGTGQGDVDRHESRLAPARLQAAPAAAGRGGRRGPAAADRRADPRRQLAALGGLHARTRRHARDGRCSTPCSAGSCSACSRAPRTPRSSTCSPGPLLIGLGVEGLHLVSAYYLVNRISSSSQLYGALGAAATLLLWGYLLARILIGASTLNHTLFRYRDVSRLPDRLPVGDEAPESFSVRGLPARLRADWRGLLADLGRGGGSQTTVGPALARGTPSPRAALTVWRFDERERAPTRPAARWASWSAGAPSGSSTPPSSRGRWARRRPRASQVLSTTASGALGGSFWGLLFGIIFFAPLLGLAVGAAAGALGGSLRDAGIGDAFIQQVRDEVTPGTSALFVMTSDVVVDQVRDAFLAHHPTLLHTNLTPEQDAALREYFGT